MERHGGRTNYENAKIYQILNSETNDVYVGSTCAPLAKRMYEHRCGTKQKQRQLHAKMKEIGEDKFYIELIEAYPCKSREELVAREGHYIRERGTLNMAVAGRTMTEWRRDNQETISEKKKLYYKQRKEHLSEYHKQWYQENKAKVLEDHKTLYTCECGATLTLSHKRRHEQCIKHKKFLHNDI